MSKTKKDNGDMNIIELFDKNTLTEKSDGNYKTECPDCGLQGGRTRGLIIFPKTNSWYCHSSKKHGGILEHIAIKHNLIKCIDCNETEEKGFVLKGSLYKDTLDCILKEYGEDFYQKIINTLNIRKSIKIPGNNRLISDFARDLAKKFRHTETLFYRSNTRNIVEIGSIKTPDGNSIEDSFIELKPNRFITLIERHFKPWTEVYTKYEKLNVSKSIPASGAKTVLVSPHFQDKMPIICRIFPVQIPIVYNNEITLPKIGYDKRFGSWLPTSSPKITKPNMSLDDAKNILHEIYKDFCFKDNQDYVNAIAALITPALRGLYSDFNVRSPVVFYRGNRERVGKDYCANITGIIYEGKGIEEPPISNNQRGGNNNDEIRKKIMAALIQGRRRFHSSNNKGLINNAVFESITTSREYSDRILGKSETLTLPNEIDFSLSGNTNVTLTPDLANRCIFVNLFLDIEDANSRNFDRPNLHKWVGDNREKILSAIYTLIRNWIEKGVKKGSKPFSSYPEWAEICGGIMEAAGYESPCVKSEKALGVASDQETEEMKQLFEMCHELHPDKWMKKKDIKKIIQESEEEIFSYFDWDKRSDQTKFGKKIDKFVGRILSDIKLHIKDINVRGSRKEYKFVKEESSFDSEKVKEKQKIDEYAENAKKVGNVGNLGNLSLPPVFSLKRIVGSREQVANVTNVAKKKTKSNREVQFWEADECKDIKPECTKKEVFEYIKKNPGKNFKDLYKNLGYASIKYKMELLNEEKIKELEEGLYVKNGK